MFRIICIVFRYALLTGTLALAGCQGLHYSPKDSYVVMGQTYYVRDTARNYKERGIASWYGPNFHGHNTATGEVYDMNAMTAAHKTLPLPCFVEVKNLTNNRRVIVRVNDRGPYHEGRIIDLSEAAAKKLDILGPGTAMVEVRTLTSEELQQLKPQTPRGQRVYVQIGAYSDQMVAREEKSRVTRLTSLTASIDPVHINGKVIHRVRIGPVYDYDAGRDIVNTLKFAGIGSYQLLD